KKPKITRPTDIFRILEIPQNDSGMPTYRSTNKYVPYKSGHYAGKTYIYVENDDDTDNYVVISDTTDVTSSSESEYEEIDMYMPRSPKYKTLIEVVLKPNSKTHDAENTHIDNIVDTTHMPTNTLTDEKWNRLKNKFLSQYLEHIGPDVSLNNELQNDDMSKDTHPNTVDVNNV
ncbi:putative EMP1-like protein, partial [Plasmodium gaboni]